ncbi:MAG: DUF2147 domain-containing protein [Ignavibacteriae bacterium]|nr:DUF2147 domain-containing protein [Ignavibacteriota bacterium]MCB9208423.1 DUF2147 domain-containing protein [Ignavibacteriales bacterium]MCB9258469.1 DUF2147 domain-containing protein [Ignavibacteriales bacterium]
MKKISYLFAVIIALLLNVNTNAQHDEITGLWKTIDDETGQPKSVVKIYLKDGKLFGDIVKLFRKPGEDPDPICDKCDDDDPRKDQKVLGMTIITDMEFQDGDNEWEDGEILDPKKGKVYDCKLWVENEKLQVRGYVLFFHRTQEWLRYDGEI